MSAKRFSQNRHSQKCNGEFILFGFETATFLFPENSERNQWTRSKRERNVFPETYACVRERKRGLKNKWRSISKGSQRAHYVAEIDRKNVTSGVRASCNPGNRIISDPKVCVPAHNSKGKLLSWYLDRIGSSQLADSNLLAIYSQLDIAFGF